MINLLDVTLMLTLILIISVFSLYMMIRIVESKISDIKSTLFNMQRKLDQVIEKQDVTKR